jgi:hypothetical protein
VGLANLGSESETCVVSRVRLVGVSISFEKNFYRLPFTPPPPLWFAVLVLQEAADALALDDDHSDVHVHVSLPRSALPAVRVAASSISYGSAAPGRPDCTSTPCRWVREHPSCVLFSVTTTSDRDVCGTSDDDTSVSGIYHL